MKTVLVAGGAGFLGSHLSDILVDKGFEVVCVDNLSTGSESNISHLLDKSTFTFIERDVRENFQFSCDIVVNMASPASPPRYILNPIGTLMTNVQGTYNLLELASLNKARFIQASTSEIYGDPLQHPQTETYWGNVNSIGQRSCYDEGKRAAETLCEDFRKQYRLDVTILRIFNSYGPRMAIDDGRVVSNFINQALLDHAITIYGNGSQTRSFCFVGDLMDAFMRVINSSVPVIGPINVGNPNEMTIVNLAKMIIKLTESKSEMIQLGLPNDDPKRRNPDISGTMSLLDWFPKTSIKDGLLETIEHFRNENVR